MQDFTAGRPRKSPKTNPADQNVRFTGLGVDDGDPDTAALKSSIAGSLAPMGNTSVSFVEPLKPPMPASRSVGGKTTTCT